MNNNTIYSSCLLNKFTYLVLNCIHCICKQCASQMINFYDDFVIKCFCGEMIPININVRSTDVNGLTRYTRPGQPATRPGGYGSGYTLTCNVRA